MRGGQVAKARNGEVVVADVVVGVPEVDLADGAGGSVYVVQVAGVGSDCVTWTDVARVVAPARSKRATILRAAARTFGALPATVRVLDELAAREHRVELRQVDPELVIG